MDQYNRLLDIFNLENGSNDKKAELLKRLNSEEPMSPEKKLQLLQKHHQEQQRNRLISPSRQSIVSNYTTNGSNLPTSINDGLTGSAHDLRMQSEYDEDSKSYSTVNKVPINENNKKKLSKINDNHQKKQNEQLINTSSLMTSGTNISKFI
jgi:hypothetical protein